MIFAGKLIQAGYTIAYVAEAKVIHSHKMCIRDRVKRFQGEIQYMKEKWMTLLKKGDPYYNPNLSLKKWDYSLRS